MAGQAQQQRGGVMDNYRPVAERIAEFYDKHPEGRILTTILEHDQGTGFVLMRAEVYRQTDDAQPAATGHAYEIKGVGHVNSTSHVENCETGAVGRALANLGLETKRQPAQQQKPGPRAVEQQQQAPAGNLSPIHQRILDLRAEAVGAGAITEAGFAAMLTKYGRREVAALTRDQALDFGTELKKLLDEHLARKK